MWRDRDPYREQQHVPDTFWLVVAALLFATSGLVWLIGQVAAILFGPHHQHLPVRLVDMLGVLLRLAGTWDDPANAWPPGSLAPWLPGSLAPWLPGAFARSGGIYAAAVLTFWIPALAYGLLVRLRAHQDRGRGSRTTLVELFGVGPVLAATFLGEVGDIGRFPSKHHFAAHTGPAPRRPTTGASWPRASRPRRRCVA